MNPNPITKIENALREIKAAVPELLNECPSLVYDIPGWTVSSFDGTISHCYPELWAEEATKKLNSERHRKQMLASLTDEQREALFPIPKAS